MNKLITITTTYEINLRSEESLIRQKFSGNPMRNEIAAMHALFGGEEEKKKIKKKITDEYQKALRNNEGFKIGGWASYLITELGIPEPLSQKLLAKTFRAEDSDGEPKK